LIVIPGGLQLHCRSNPESILFFGGLNMDSGFRLQTAQAAPE
jgi:hypothetical protein